MKIIENSECFDDLFMTFSVFLSSFSICLFDFSCTELALEELCKFILDLKSNVKDPLGRDSCDGTRLSVTTRSPSGNSTWRQDAAHLVSPQRAVEAGVTFVQTTVVVHGVVAAEDAAAQRQRGTQYPFAKTTARSSLRGSRGLR